MVKHVFDTPQGIQRSIIYLLKSDDDFHHQIVTLVKETYFELQVNQTLFAIITKYREKYKTLPSNDIILNEAKSLIKKGETLADYEDELIHADRVGAYAVDNKEYVLECVEKFAKRAAARDALELAVELAKEDKYDAILDTFREVLKVSRHIDVGHKYYTDIESRLFVEDIKQKKFPFVLARANEHLEGGHSAKELCMVAAPPGVGKSLMLVNQAVHLLRHGHKCLYISLEMAENKIAQRFDSIITEIDVKKAKQHKKEVVESVTEFYRKHPDSGLVIKEFPTGQANVNHIRVLLNQLKNQNKFVPDVILVDYLELLKPIRYIDGEYLAQQRIAEELRGLAVEMNILMWTATQTNRDARKAQIIKDVHLADSYGKVRTADWVISLNQTDDERTRGQMRTYVLKARDGKTNYVIPTCVDYSTLVMFDNIEESITDKV